MIIGVLDVAFELGIDWGNAILLTLIALPVGLLACYVFYSVLDKKWKKEDELNKREIDDIGRNDRDLDNIRGFK